jgi:hypothetical protein
LTCSPDARPESVVRWLLVFVCVLVPIAVHAQDLVTLHGTIVDSATHEPLRFVTVRLVGSTKGTISSKHGEFRLVLDKGSTPTTTGNAARCLVFSLVGYATDTVCITLEEELLSVELVRKDVRAPMVVVTAEDPAVRIMRSVLERKAEQIDTLDRYTYMLYTKFVAITDTATARRGTGLGDSTIFSILESFSKGYVDLPNDHYNEIIQRRQTANVPPAANFVSFGTTLNTYDDGLEILGELIETPFHPDALDDFVFSLRSDESEPIAEIEFEPVSNGFKAFSGWVFVDKARRMPVEVRLKPNVAVNLPFGADLQVRQTFTDLYGPIMPEALSLVSTADISLLWVINPRIDIDLETFCYDYDFTEQFSDEVFSRRRVELAESSDVLDTTYWRQNMKLPLRKEEEHAYFEIQQFMENPDSVETFFMEDVFGSVFRVLRTVTREPFTWYDDFVRYNNVHGLYLGVGLQFRPDTVIEVKATGGWGFNDKRPYASLHLTTFIDTPQHWSLDVGVFSVLRRRDDANVVRTGLITMTTLLFGNDYGDYYYADGWEAGLSYSWGQLRFLRGGRFGRTNSARLFIRSERQSSASTIPTWSLFNQDGEKRQNPAIMPGSLQSVGGEVLLSYRPERRISRTGMFLRGEVSDPRLITTDFDFWRAECTGFLRVRTIPLWTLDVHIELGWAHGDVPPQRFFSLESSVSGIAVGSAFRVMRVKEFYGDRYATLSLSHNFGEVIPGLLRIPNIAAFGIEFITFGSMGYSVFSPQTQEFTRTTLASTDQTKERFYGEVGLGINRILLFFRFDVNVRFTQNDRPDWSVTISSATF